MKPTLLPLVLLSILTAAVAAPAPLMTTPGPSLLSDPLTALSPAWQAAKGRWTIQDGTLRGESIAEQNHPATYRHALSFTDAVIQFEVRLGDARAVTLSLNDRGGHAARVILTPKGFQARKDDHDHDGPDRAAPFNDVQMPLAPGTWHTVTVEVLGPRLLASVDGQTAPAQLSFGQADLIASPKTNVGLTVQGGAASFRNLTVQRATPNPAWADPAPQPAKTKGK